MKTIVEGAPAVEVSPSVACLLIDQRVADAGLCEALLASLQCGGFERIDGIALDEAARRRLSAEAADLFVGEVAGRRWSHLVVVADLYPWPGEREAGTWENPRVPVVMKSACHWLRREWKKERRGERKEPLASIPDDAFPVRATPTTATSWAAVRQFMPGRRAICRQKIAEMERGFTPPFGVLSPLTRHSSTSRTDLIRYNHELAVCKTFRPTRRRSFEATVELLEACQDVSEIPTPLEVGDGWIVFPYYADHEPISVGASGLLPLPVARRVFLAVREMFERGYAYCDLKPANIMCDGSGDVKIVDMESAYRYSDEKPTFAQSLDIIGARYFADDRWARRQIDALPAPYLKPFLPTYADNWHPNIGLQLAELLQAPRLLQQVRRGLYLLRNPGRMLRGLRSKIALRTHLSRMLSVGAARRTSA